MSALIFGVNSQDGQYLKKIIENKGVRTLGVSRSEGNWIRGDIGNRDFVSDIIKSEKPDVVFHLAANSSTKHSALFENHDTISTGTLNLFESVKNHSPNTKVFITGSGVQFKNKGSAISENDDFEASSPYSIARIQSVYAARYYRTLGIRSYVGYLFHHESPLRKGHHVSKLIAEKVNKIANGAEDKIALGDISIRKEWAYSHDIALGIYTLINQDDIFEAAIGTGKAYSIQDWLEVCFNLVGKDWKSFVETNESNFKAEYKLLVSDPSTINKLGWFPQTSFEELAKIMLGISKS
ncbi:MAG: GDP-mannose 4,6-dehydratase [Puia sp.]